MFPKCTVEVELKNRIESNAIIFICLSSSFTLFKKKRRPTERI